MAGLRAAAEDGSGCGSPGIRMIPLIGENNIMWGSDYPHPDGIWPDSQKWIAEDLEPVSPAVRRKIVCENAGKLYGLL